ncbi:hypothetical protein [Ruegeria arenilitoris]|uniref:hypothetical protein n=1 Tax=Ruegeria arenilitoris TaxID=1173585 RepID=UPI00147B0C08|nr:hypothetical protein [Ruegeria arenilitoris]
MERFSTIKNLSVVPALVIALTAGSAMAGPGEHSDGTANQSTQIGRSETPRDMAYDAANTSTTVTRKIANLSPLEATQDMGNAQEFPTVTGKMVNRITNLSPLDASQNVGTGPLDTGGSLSADSDFYLDGEAHFLSASTDIENGSTETNARVGATDGAITQDAEQKIQDMSAGQYIDAFGKAITGALKFNAWKDNPNKPPIGRPIGNTRAAHTAQFETNQS